MGPLDLNFPTPYGIASINYNSLPAPAVLTKYVGQNLFAKADQNLYSGSSPAAREYLLENPAGYQAAAVRYVITPADDDFTVPPITPYPLKDLTDDVLHQSTIAYTMTPGTQDLKGTITANLSSTSIASALVFVGTYLGLARGELALTLCAAGQWEMAVNNVDHAPDSRQMAFKFPSPLTVPRGAELSYRFSHPDGTPLTIWMTPNENSVETPSLAFIDPAGATIRGVILADSIRHVFTLVFRNSDLRDCQCRAIRFVT